MPDVQQQPRMVSGDEVTTLSIHGWYDGPLCGLATYQEALYHFELVDAAAATYHLYPLPAAPEERDPDTVSERCPCTGPHRDPIAAFTW